MPDFISRRNKGDLVYYGVAIVVGLATLGALVGSIVWEIQMAVAGDLKVHDLSQACVVRGPKDLGLDTDFLAVSTLVENTGDAVKTIEAPRLELKVRSPLSAAPVELQMIGLATNGADVSPVLNLAPASEISVPGHSTQDLLLVFGPQGLVTGQTSASQVRFAGEGTWDGWLFYVSENGEMRWNYGKIIVTIPANPQLNDLGKPGQPSLACW